MKNDSLNLTPLTPFGVLITPKEASWPLQDVGINELKGLFREYGLLLLRGFKTSYQTNNDFTAYSQKWGEVALWPFGAVLELVERQNPEDHIFDSSYVPLHWDGMYRPHVPEYQLFYCQKAPLAGQGGRTTFSHTPLVLKNTPSSVKALWSRVTGVYHRKMEFYHSKITSPIITTHPFRGYEVIRYNEPPSPSKGRFINPPHLEFLGISQEEQTLFHQSLQEALYDPRHFYAHEWQEGDLVIADNFSLLHGRESFISQSPRHLKRVHVLGDTPFINHALESYNE